MALLTVRKVVVLSGAAVPLMGYFGTVSAQSMDNGADGELSKPIRACDIPMYPVNNALKSPPELTSGEPPNSVQKQITSIRMVGNDVYDQVMSGYEYVKDKAMIGKEHSRSTIDYVQTNPGELPRVGFISLAAAGGVIIGYRRSVLRKILYSSVAGLSAAALCYPNRTVDLSSAVAEDARGLWKENIGWPLTDTDEDKSKRSGKAPAESKVMKILKPQEDHGQSKQEDKDLYSTRSS